MGCNSVQYPRRSLTDSPAAVNLRVYSSTKVFAEIAAPREDGGSAVVSYNATPSYSEPFSLESTSSFWSYSYREYVRSKSARADRPHLLLGQINFVLGAQRL